MIRAKNLRKDYGGRNIFDQIDFEISPGEMVAITGPSGSGKSTLLNIFSGLENRDGGELNLFGNDNIKAGNRQVRKLWRDKIGFLFQNYGLIEDDTVEANLTLAQAFRKGSGRKDRETALDRVGLKDFHDKPIFTLSGGERQRVALARLILKPCEVIFADEPTGNLDDDNSHEVIEIFKELQGQGKAIVLVTHNQSLLSHFDHVYHLEPKALVKVR